jgi:hypothetical protein
MRPNFSAIKSCALNVSCRQFLTETEVKVAGKNSLLLVEYCFYMAILDLISFSPITKLQVLHTGRAAYSG